MALGDELFQWELARDLLDAEQVSSDLDPQQQAPRLLLRYLLLCLLLGSGENELIRALHLLVLVLVSQCFALNQCQARCFSEEDLKSLQDTTLGELKSCHTVRLCEILCQLVHQTLRLGAVEDGRA